MTGKVLIDKIAAIVAEHGDLSIIVMHTIGAITCEGRYGQIDDVVLVEESWGKEIHIIARV
jgi:hypothetical protein